MAAITASVVLYNTPSHQLKQLSSCLEQSSIDVKLYVIDNSPGNDPINIENLSGATYFRCNSNKGYGAGHNIALRDAITISEFHFVLNSDIYFGPDELEKMVRFMRENPRIGQSMPRVTYPDGSLQYLCKLLPTPADLFLRRFMLKPGSESVRRRKERFELRFTGYNREMDVPCLSGCFMLFRTSALREIGLFDERFFMYLEDVDITRRMNAKFRTVFFPGATIVHHHSRDSYKSFRALFIHIQNLIRYFNKWGWIRDARRASINQMTLRRLEEESLSSEGVTIEA